MKNITLFTCLIILPVLNSCTGIKIQSINSPKLNEYNKQIEKIYLLINVSEDPSSYATSLAVSLKTAFETANILSEYHVYRSLSLITYEEIQAKIDIYKPDILLTINQSYSGNAKNAQFVTTLYDPITKDILWKASTSAINSIFYPTSSQVALKIIEQMRNDNIIRE